MKGKSGSCRRAALAVSLAGLWLAGPAFARDGRPFRIDDGSIATAIRTIASETGAEIVTLEPGIAIQTVRRRTLGPDAARALREVLKRTPYRAIRVGPNSYRIVRRAPEIVRPRRSIRQMIEPVGESADGIVVEAKFPTLLANYPGSVQRLTLGDKAGAVTQTSDLADVAHSTPVLSTTAFGDGRDKVFIRGIADSSFNGASQPTTSIYFGDALIGFGSPNPNLRLYDVSSLEILEGPQGTLYGSGSVGGVIRIVPNPVDLSEAHGSVTGAFEITAGGAPGRSEVGMLNLPLASGKAGLRLVGYDERKGGYIADPGQGSNLNRVAVSGGRVALAGQLAGGFQLEVTGIYQATDARDSQYADATGPLARRATISEPYSSDLALGVISVRKRWANGNEFASIASVGKRTANDRFDASAGRIQASALETERTSVMLSSESRLSGRTASGVNWVTGLAIDYVEDGQSRAFGVPDSTNPLDEVTNLTKTFSTFGQARLNLLPEVEATAGLRFTLSRTDSRPARNGQTSYINGDLAKRFDPTVALLWHAASGLALYGRFQTGFRNGGVTVARGVGKVASFQPDSIALGEVGARYTGLPGLVLSGALSLARWNNVLGDLVSMRGTAVATNLGDAKMFAAEASAQWDSGSGWSIAAAALVTDNRLTGDIAMQSDPRNRLLPSVPKFSANGKVRYSAGPDRAGLSWSAGLSAQYVGRSVLGPGTLLDIDQGNYTRVDFDARLAKAPFSLSLQIENLLDSHANRFALGNPLTLYRRDGFVPLRPRTAAIALAFGW